MAEVATQPQMRSIDQKSGNALNLKLVQADAAPKLQTKPCGGVAARPEYADDLDDLWDNVPI